MSPEEIEARLGLYPAEPGSERAKKMERAREMVVKLTLELNAMVPTGRENSLMVTHLEEALVWANKGISRWG